jgi:hypothetical protein
MITALVVLFVAGIDSPKPVTPKPPQRKPPQVKVEEPAEGTPEEIARKKPKRSNGEVDAEVDAEVHKRVIGGVRTGSAETARKIQRQRQAQQQAAYAASHTVVEVRVSLEGSVYVARIGDRVIRTNSARDIANAIPAAGVRRLDLSGLPASKQDAFEKSVPADERARLKFVRKSEPLFDPGARPVPGSFKTGKLAPEPDGGFRQEAAFKVGAGKSYSVHVTASKRIVARFFELLAAYFASPPHSMSAQAIISAVTQQVARENKIKESDLQVQIKDDLKQTIFVELLLRRLIDAG